MSPDPAFDELSALAYELLRFSARSPHLGDIERRAKIEAFDQRLTRITQRDSDGGPVVTGE